LPVSSDFFRNWSFIIEDKSTYQSSFYSWILNMNELLKEYSENPLPDNLKKRFHSVNPLKIVPPNCCCIFYHLKDYLCQWKSV